MTKYYREWALQPNFRRGSMIPAERFVTICKASDPGYSSVYMFDEEAAKQVLADKSSVGLDRFPVSTDTLTIDLDNGESQLRKACEALLGYGYEVWESGGKGFHIVLKLTAMVTGKNVPYSQRKWVEALDIGADLSLYQHGRIISLPGRVHPKTGKRKRLVSHISGDLLELPLLDQPTPVFSIGTLDGEVSEYEAGLWKLLALLQSEPGPGNRHTALWATAKHFADAGIDHSTTLDLLTQANATWDSPKTEAEVATAVNQAYKK